MIGGLLKAYRLRWKRRRFLFRIWRKRREIAPVIDRTGVIETDDILVFATVRNEMLSLPHFLAHYRKLGVRHFLMVDNGSDDGTAGYLKDQPDVSLWQTEHAYRLARFGMDWVGWLLWRYGQGHWCLTVDADELLVYPGCETRDLPALTAWLNRQGKASFGAVMVDLYPKGGVTDQAYMSGQDPTEVLGWFDPDIHHQRHRYYDNLWIQGGVRDRLFFAAEPARAPTLNTTPLVRWHWRYAYVSSTHQILPARLHRDVFDFDAGQTVNGALLHTKFLPDVADRAVEDQERGQHFQNSVLYQDYYRTLATGPDLWHPGAVAYRGPESLIDAGLMCKGAWV